MLQIITVINRELATRYILKQSKVFAPGLGKTNWEDITYVRDGRSIGRNRATSSLLFL